MKRLVFFGILMYLCVHTISAQSASIGEIDFLDYSTSIFTLDSDSLNKNEIPKIPTCENPTDISVQLKKSDILISWNNPSGDQFELDINFINSSRSQEVLTTTGNSLTLNKMNRSEIANIQIRRVCSDYGKILTSDWVEVLSSSIEPCDDIQPCTELLTFFEYQVEEIEINSVIEYRKQWKMTTPTQWESVEFVYQGLYQTIKNNSSVSWEWIDVKTVILSPGQFEYVDVPEEVIHSRLVSVKIQENGQSILGCDDYYMNTPDYQNDCSQNFFFTQNESDDGGTDFNIYLISNETDINSALLEYSDGSEETIALEGCPFNGMMIYLGTHNSCDDFTLEAQGCLAFEIENSCNNIEEEYDCEDFSYSTLPSPYTAKPAWYDNQSQEGNSLCYMKWSFPIGINQGAIQKLSGGPSYDVLGNHGVLLFEAGEYVLSYSYMNSQNQELNCSSYIQIECNDNEDPPLSEEEIDNIIPCDIFNYDYVDFTNFNGSAHSCNFSWEVREDVNVVVSMQPLGTNTPMIFSANSGSIALGNIEWEVSYMITYDDPEYGIISNECDAFIVGCPNNDDSDDDGILDDGDNCPDIFNPNQMDSDYDGVGDVCEIDSDSDGIIDDIDNCVFIANQDQADFDQDGVGDVCEENNDADSDGIPDDIDNCPLVPNTNQIDTNDDGVGDACDEEGADSDGDGVDDVNDNCPAIPNSDQTDSDLDGVGDVCEQDTDADGVIDDVDNCVYTENPDQLDNNFNGIGDACEEDLDSDDDGILDTEDNCPSIPNANQQDLDEDGVGDVCELDSDGDGVIDDIDNCWLKPNADQSDADGDGIGDVCEGVDDSLDPDAIEIDEDFICSLFSNLTSEYITENTIVFKPEFTLYEVLEREDMDLAAFYTQLSLVDKVTLTVQYVNENGQVEESIVVFDASQYDILTSFDLESISFLIENNSAIEPNVIIQADVISIDGIGRMCAEKLVTLEEESVPEDEEVEIPEIPSLECGEDFDSPEDSENKYLDKLEKGMTLFMNGFPLVVTDVEIANSPFKGTAILPVPFGDKLLTVPFEGLEIKENFVISSGSINMKASAEQLNSISVVNVPVLSVGDNYCVPPESVSMGAGPNGPTDGEGEDGTNDGNFGDDGIHTGTGTEYDWNGFDVNGNHFSDTDHNEFGCKADGTHYITGEDCDPSQPYSDIETIIKELEPVLDDHITKAIEDLLEELNIDINSLNCDSKRTALTEAFDAYVSDKTDEEKEVIRGSIFGKGDEFLNEGLSSQFISAPSLPSDDNTRDEQIKNIEKYHVNLYLCDSNKSKFGYYSEALNNEEIIAELKAFIIEEISKWTEYQVKELFNPSNKALFDPWLIEMIDIFFIQKERESDTGFIYENLDQNSLFEIEKKMKRAFDFSQSDYFATASMEFIDFRIDDHQREAFDFEFDQGFKEVLGINRAFFLEEIAEMNGGNSSAMPMKILAPMNGKTVNLYLDDLRINPNSATIDVYAIIETSNGKVVLQADDVVISSAGVESANLKLLSPIVLKLFNPAKIIIDPVGTSLTWTCEGLDDFQVKAQVEICDQYIKPYDLTTKQILPGNVTFDIEAGGSGWMEFHTTINGSHPFVVTKYESWAFDLQTLVIDTDSEYTPDFSPMIGYTSNFLIGNPDDALPDKLGPGWKGMYLEKLLIDIPEKLASGGALDAIVFEDMLFDDQGASGQVSIETSLLSLEEGNAGGWGISIDGFSLAVMKNNISGFGLNGQIQTPLFEEPMEYTGSMHENDTYSLVVKADLEEKKNVPLFLAEAELTAFEINALSSPAFENMQLSATLSGTIEVKGDSITQKLENLPKMRFSNLTIRNFGERKLEVEEWELIFESNPKPIKLMGMELGFGNEGANSFKIKTNYEDEPNKVGIPMNVTINFLEDLGVVLGGSFDVVGRLDEGVAIHKWVYSGLKLNEFCAKVTTSAVEVDACLSWYDDQDYGKGFRGEGWMNLSLGPLDVGVNIISEFGSKNGSKYFFLDALAEFEPISVAPPFGISGFGGGVSYGMRPDFDPTGSIFTGIDNDDGGIGTTYSGGTYTPDDYYGLSVKALVLFEIMKLSDIFNGSAFLSVTMDHTGSLDNIQFGGVANLMAEVNLSDIPVLDDPIEKIENFANAEEEGNITAALNALVNKPLGASVNGYVFFKLDLKNKVFTGDMKVFMNLIGVLEGAGEDGAVVNASLRFASPKDWYINIGTPQNLCGIKLDLVVLEAQLSAYFDVGTTIPSFTTDHLPPKIRAFVKNNVQVSEAFRKSGGGIMFGMGFNVEIHASIWVGSFDAYCGAGFDVMLRKTDATCLGSNGSVGVDGWYAMGQVYAYVDAGLTIAGVEVLGVGLYAVMNAQFPNPTYMQAALRIRLKILFVSVDKTLRLEIGEKCALDYENPDDAVAMDAISLVLPFNGSTEVLTDENLEVNFAVSLDKPLEVEDDKSYVVTNDAYELVDEFGDVISLSKSINEEKNIVILKPSELLKGNTTYTLTASVDILVKILDEVVDEVTQTKSTEFTTSAAYSDIPFSNIEYAYPVPGMYNFYLKEKISFEENSGLMNMVENGGMHSEVTECYIKLEKGQQKLFEQFDEGYHNVIELYSNNYPPIYRKFEYDYINRTIKYSLPTDMPMGEIYTMQVVLMSDEKLQELENGGTVLPNDLGSASINQSLLGHESESVEPPAANQVVLLMYSFRVSEFESFTKKMQTAKMNNSTTQNLVSFEIDLQGAQIDKGEFYGVDQWDPLVEFTFEDSRWEKLYDEVFKPFEALYDMPEITSLSLQNNFNKATYLKPVDFAGVSPEALFVEDLTSQENTSNQTMNISHDETAEMLHFNFMNSIKQVFFPMVSQYNGSIYSGQCGFIDYENTDKFNDFITCVLEKVSGNKYAFINSYRYIILNSSYPYWSENNDNNLHVNMQYIMPNGEEGSRFEYTFK